MTWYAFYTSWSGSGRQVSEKQTTRRFHGDSEAAAYARSLGYHWRRLDAAESAAQTKAEDAWARVLARGYGTVVWP